MPSLEQVAWEPVPLPRASDAHCPHQGRQLLLQSTRCQASTPEHFGNRYPGPPPPLLSSYARTNGSDMPWARPSCFYILLANGNDRATPHSKNGCLWWAGAGGGPTVCPERCHSSSIPPAQLCQVSLQASANLLGSRRDQAHFA